MPERKHAGAYWFSARDRRLRDDPVAHLGRRVSDLPCEGRQQRHWIDLNQDLSNFWRLGERRESKWELDSRNVPYGIFSATPKKCQMTL
jgi:hypothetical protein